MPDRLRPRRTGLGQLRPHVLLLEGLDRVPVQMQFLGNILDRARPAASAHVVGKAFGIDGVGGQEIELLALHRAAASAANAPNFDLEIDARIAAGQVANLARASVVPAHMRSTTAAAERFFERRSRLMTRAFGSPKMPRTVGCARKPGNAYVSHSRRFRFVEVAMQTCSQFPAAPGIPDTHYPRAFQPDSPLKITHSIS